MAAFDLESAADVDWLLTPCEPNTGIPSPQHSSEFTTSEIACGVHGDVGTRRIVLASSEEHIGLDPDVIRAVTRGGVLGA